ncbi:MAG TPA: hypothetical protein VK662_09795, partial [Acidothermaceae bacterium]|nr:hypothetical protein [Acidothermaceae bacterium]
SNVPANAEGLPPYVVGGATSSPAPGTIRTQVVVSAPIGGGVVAASVDGVPTQIGTGSESGRSEGIVFVDVAPGAKKTIDIQLVSAQLSPDIRAHGLTPLLRLTPLAQPALLHLPHISCTND